MSTSNVIILIIVLLLLLLLLLLWLLRARLRHEWPFPPAYPVREFIIENELVIAGSAAAIAGVLTDQRVRQVQMVEVNRLDFSGFPVPAKNCAGLPDDYVITLYRLLGTQPNLQNALDVINAAGGTNVFAEPNRITGKPWDPEPGPWDPEPGSYKGPASVSLATEADFARQWAFKLIGLLPYSQNTQAPHGGGVIVGVFDTSPYSPPEGVGQAFALPMPQPFGVLTLIARQIHDWSNMSPSLPGPDLSDHGLFVAGLVHAVAPLSDIRLVKVLDTDRRGSMYRLMVGVHDFMTRDMLPRYGTGRDRTVMNFSLGIRIPPEDAATFTHIPDVYNAMRIFENMMKLAQCMGAFVAAASGNESDKFPAPQLMNFPALLSIGKPDPLPGKVVDRLDNVMGVASCTIQETISCFSNEGSIAAPGGNGERRPYVLPGIMGMVERILPGLIQWLGPQYLKRAAPGQAGGPLTHGSIIYSENCEPHTGEYTGPDCEFGVIGPIHDGNTGTAIKYRYWAGTSFATPLVSGLGAVYGSAGMQNPDDIRQVIENTVIIPPGRLAVPPTIDDGMGKGIIHIPENITQIPGKNAPGQEARTQPIPPKADPSSIQ